MIDPIGDLIGAVLDVPWTIAWPTPRRRVLRALRLSRKRRLTRKRREFAITRLAAGLEDLPGLRLESREQEMKAALERVSQDR